MESRPAELSATAGGLQGSPAASASSPSGEELMEDEGGPDWGGGRDAGAEASAAEADDEGGEASEPAATEEDEISTLTISRK